MRRGTGRLLALAALAVVLLVLFGGRLIDLYVEWLWFGSVGFRSVFLTAVTTQLLLFLGGGAVFLAVFLSQALLARRAALGLLGQAPVRVVFPGEDEPPGPFGTVFGGQGPRGDRPPGGPPPRPFADLAASFGGPEAGAWALRRLVVPVAVAVGLFLALIMGLAAAGAWEEVLRWWHAVPFGTADPVFDRDVAFHVFTLPVIDGVQSWLFWAVLLTLLACAAVYLLALYCIDPSYERALFHLETRARAMRTHLLLLVAVLAALVAVGVWLGGYDLLLVDHARMVGANYTDVHTRLPATRALAVTALAWAVLASATAFRRGYGLLLGGAAVVAVVLLVGRGVLPFVVQKLQVEPAELAQETPYLAQNIRFTRQAYGVDAMIDVTFPAEDTVRPEEIKQNNPTVANVRLWDHRPLRDTLNQIQSIRPYYNFGDVDVERYTIDGRYRQVLLGAREMVVERLGAQAQTWVNRKLQFTHGYGVTMSAVNEVSREGLPAFLVQDLPPAGQVHIERPEIYYGEQTTSYAVVNTGTQEFDFPSGDQNVFSTYRGTSGVSVGPIWRRAALAWYFGDFNMLVSTYLRPESRVLFNRAVTDRVRTIAPFLKLDADPYLVIAQGQLVWLLDAYTTADRYPYSRQVVELAPCSTPSGNGFLGRVTCNYVRNSVKVAVNAYDGAVTFYLADPSDPIARTYAGIFPDLFRPLSAMPSELRAQVRYPEDLFRVQTEILRTYHVTDPQVFYNGEDVWSPATELETTQSQPAPPQLVQTGPGQGVPVAPAAQLAQSQSRTRRVDIAPYFVIMRLPGQPNEEFLLMRPFTPRGRDNMVAWLAARSDGADYGKLVLVKYPRDRLIYGPAQIDARIDQTPDISAQLTLWNQQGSRVIRGNLLVIPIGASTLYVEPIYLQAENSRLPELKRVVVASGNRLAMEATLEEALVRIFGPDLGLTLPAAADGAPAGPAQPASPAAPTGVSPAAAEAARAAREAYQRALDALRAGDFAKFGDELKNVDDRLKDLERATAAP